MDVRGQIWLPFSLIRARKLARMLLFVVLTYHSDQFETVFSFNIFLMLSAVRLGCKHIIRFKLKTLCHFHCSNWWVGSSAFKKMAVLNSYQKISLTNPEFTIPPGHMLCDHGYITHHPFLTLYHAVLIFLSIHVIRENQWDVFRLCL